MSGNSKSKRTLIDLTGDDEDDQLSKKPVSATFFNPPQNPDEKKIEPASIENDFMAMLKKFIVATKHHLDENTLSHIILTIADDNSFKKEYFLKLRISLCETAAALGTDNVADKVLKELRLANHKELLDSDRFRIPAEWRANPEFEKMYNYIDDQLAAAVWKKIKNLKDEGDFLIDFFTDFIAEIQVISGKHVNSILAKSAYLIGKGFLDNTIKAPEIKTDIVANLFLNFASEHNNPQAKSWIEKQKSKQAKR